MHFTWRNFTWVYTLYSKVNMHLLFNFSAAEITWCSHFISLGVISLGCTHFSPKVNVSLLNFATLFLQVK